MHIEPIAAFSDNYIWAISDPSQGTVAVVDPGDASPVFVYLRQKKLKLVAILATHHHADHVGGIQELIQEFPIPVYGPGDESIPKRTQACHEGQHIRLNNLQLNMSVLSIPGHTSGHIAYYGHDVLFCGDTLFMGGCGRLFEGTPQQMYDSLQKIAHLPEDTLIYCAHEYTEQNLHFASQVEPNNPHIQQRIKDVKILRKNGQASIPATLLLEKRTNPFLRSHFTDVKQAAERHAHCQLNTNVEVFATLRRWKDSF